MTRVCRWVQRKSLGGVVLATWFIRPELSGKRGLSSYFTLIIFWEQHDGQNPTLVTRARQTLNKTRDFSLDRRPFRSDTQSNRSGYKKCVAQLAIDCAESTD